MLLVDARVGPSRIHGMGLIAHQAIAAGTLVWRLHQPFDLVLSEAEFVRLPRPARRTLAYYACFDLLRREFVLSGDDDRFTNHAARANCRMTPQGQYAVADLDAGDEITVDYHELGWTWFCGVPCTGSPPPKASKTSRRRAA